MTLRLAVLREERIVPYATAGGDRRRAWSLSEVSVAQHRLAACPVPTELQAAANNAKAEWGAWERESDRFVLGLLTLDGDAFTLAGQAGDGSPVHVRYTLQEGLSWHVVALAE